MILRDFLYLDQPMVRDFLAQMEGGVVDEATERQKSAGKGSIGGKVGVGPVQAGGEKAKEHSLETEAVVRQSAASEFQRLYDYLDDDDLLVLEQVDEVKILQELTRKQIVEADARVVVSGTHQLLDVMGQFAALAPLAKQLGQDLDLDPEMAKGMEMMQSLGAAEGKLHVIASVPGSAGAEVALELDQTHVTTDSWDHEATVLFRVQRILKKDERYMVGDPLGGVTKHMPEAERNKLVDSLQSNDLSQLIGKVEIVGPAVVGIPIAIYR